jgi:peptide/nickel transport system substrate-binding protein
MTDDDTNGTSVDRRKFLAGLGAGATAGLAGCTDGGDGGDGGDGSDGGDGGDGGGTTATTTTTPPDGSIQEGGKPTIGMAVPPDTLNPLQAGTVYSFYIIDRIFSPGTTIDPNDNGFEPWVFTDWELSPENAGTDEPTLANVQMRDDMQFHDGEDLTAEDFAFSVRYYREQEPTGSLTAAAHKKLRGDPGDGVEIVDDTTVNIYFAEKEQRWFTNVLGFPILPQHIWSEVDDYTTYSPRQSEEGVVGSGPFQLTEFNWENWYEFEPAYDEYPPANADYASWIDDGAPFVDGLRIEVYGSQNRMEQEVLEGNLTTGYVSGGFTVNNALQAQSDDSLTVRQSSESGYNHISYNLRRKPFDDVAFRQFLNKTFDKQWVVNQPYDEIGAVQGDYVVVPALSNYRPPEPPELWGESFQADGLDEFEFEDYSPSSVSVPDLSFPGEAGSFDLNEEEIQTARDFLVNNPDAKYDYSFGESQTSITTSPDGQELYVDGEHITQAHTDNDGNPGQGPIVYSFQPPQEDIYQARYGQQQTGLLKKLGIPVEPLVKTINAQIPTVYGQEDFDMYSMGWGLGVNVTHLAALYSSEGADLESDTDQQVFNPMGYTGADPLIFKDLEQMDFGQRFPLVQQICARTYADAPTNITDVAQLLEPTRDEFTGWVGGLGTTVNQDSFLNIRQSS